MIHADPNDFATDLEQRERDAGLAAIRNRRSQSLVANGACHNCEEPLPEGQVFCARMDGEVHCCRSDYELRLRRG